MNFKRLTILFCASFLLVACGDDDGMTTPDVPTADMNPGDTDTPDMATDTDTPDTPDVPPPPDPTCENLCTLAMANCDGDLAAYGSMEECMNFCENIGAWEAGTTGDTDGNTIACRISFANTGNCVAGGFTGGGVRCCRSRDSSQWSVG